MAAIRRLFESRKMLAHAISPVTIFFCLSSVVASDASEQIPSLKSLPDRSDELQAQIDRSGGNLTLGAEKVIRITKPLRFDLAVRGAVSVRATAGVTLVMDGPGPALRFIGSHQGTASPSSFKPGTWNERMPLVSGIEIVGNHDLADGIELSQTVGAVIRNTSIRWCRHGIHLVNRNRNVIVDAVHLYENSGAGLYLDNVNLHQINVSASHVSYNRQGGIVVRNGNVRNLQVNGCDIEGNMPGDGTPTTTANVLIDVSDSTPDRAVSVAEVSITGCTIQHAANYGKGQAVAPGGSNIRLAGRIDYPIDSVTISGNVLSDTTTNIDLKYVNDVAISANNFFAPNPANLTVRKSERVVVVGNTFNPRQFRRPGTIELEDSKGCIVANSTLHHFDTDNGALILRRCSNCSLDGLILSDCGSGIVLSATTSTSISNCRVTGTNKENKDVSIDASCSQILLNGNAFGGKTQIAPGTLPE